MYIYICYFIVEAIKSRIDPSTLRFCHNWTTFSRCLLCFESILIVTTSCYFIVFITPSVTVTGGCSDAVSPAGPGFNSTSYAVSQVGLHQTGQLG